MMNEAFLKWLDEKANERRPVIKDRIEVKYQTLQCSEEKRCWHCGKSPVDTRIVVVISNFSLSECYGCFREYEEDDWSEDDGF